MEMYEHGRKSTNIDEHRSGIDVGGVRESKNAPKNRKHVFEHTKGNQNNIYEKHNPGSLTHTFFVGQVPRISSLAPTGSP